MSESTIGLLVAFGIPWLLLGMRILESHWIGRRSAAGRQKARAASVRSP